MIIADGDRSYCERATLRDTRVPLGKRCKKKGTQRRVVGKIEPKNSRKGYNFYIRIIIYVISIPSYRVIYTIEAYFARNSSTSMKLEIYAIDIVTFEDE